MPARPDLRWLVAVLLASFAGRVGALPSFNFLAPPTSQGWSAERDLGPLTVESNGLVLHIRGPRPALLSPPMELPARPGLCVRFHLRSESGEEMRLTPLPASGPGPARPPITFRVRSNHWGDVCLPLPPLPTAVRFRLEPATNGVTRLTHFRLEETARLGITRIVASGNRLDFTVDGVEGPAEVVELPPFEQLHDVVRGSPVYGADFQGETRFSLPRRVFRSDRNVDRIFSSFAVRRRLPGDVGWESLGAFRHVEEFHRLAGVAAAPILAPRPGKKGLQVQMTADALELGIAHAALNVDLNALMDPRGLGHNYRWDMEGETYHFHRGAVDGIPVQPLSDAGMGVYLILLNYAGADRQANEILLHPDYDASSPNRLAMFNTRTPSGYRWYRAAVEFLAHRFSGAQPGAGRVAGYIVGNELTAHWHWANQGDAPPEAVIDDYLRAVRITHAAVQAASPDARVYLSLDHHWNLVYEDKPRRAMAGRYLLDEFNRRATLGGNFEWHLAYHPYPENLGNPRTWLDRTALPTAESPRITFKNLEVLTAYLERPEFQFSGRTRRIILSEQGFHSDGTPAGEEAQAAGFAYAWKKVNALPGIDAFILHRHVDHGQEGGLNLGLWRRRPDSMADPLSPKPMYHLFKAAGTPGEDAAFEPFLRVIGIPSWDRMRPSR
ncbi:MAG: DUF5722 domain-containing protein [Verrucomicrobiota bacterium]